MFLSRIKKHKFKLKDAKGFTFIDVLLAMVFVSVSIMALGVLLVSITGYNRHARQRTAATTLAEDKIEELQDVGYSGLTEGTTTETLDEDTSSTGPYTRTTVIDASSYPALKTITVTVSWPRPGGSQPSVTLRTSAAK